MVEAIGSTEGAHPMNASRRMSTRWLFGRLRRVTSGGSYIPEIDGMRFAAIFWVFLFHVGVDLAAKDSGRWRLPAQGASVAIAAGAFGVQIFFVISGFVLALPFARHRLLGGGRVSLRKYFLRRVTRLEPPYMLVMVVLFVIVAFRSRDVVGYAGHLLASLIYSHGLVFGAESAINNVAWSLEIEIQFYILVPLLTLIFLLPRRSVRLAVLGCSGLAIAALGAVMIPQGSRASFTVLNYAAYFLTGFILADLHLQGWTRRARSYIWDLWGVGAAVALLAILSAGANAGATFLESVSERVFLPPLCLLLVMCAFRGTICGWLVTRPLITIVGGMCYSIYLVHNAVLSVSLSATRFVRTGISWELDYAIQVVLSILPVAVASVALFVLVERPCMQADWPARLVSLVRRKLTAIRRLAFEPE